MLERLVCGDVPKKHHTVLKGPEGDLRYEHCVTRDGFDGPYTIGYHKHRPHTARHVAAKDQFAVGRAAPERELLRRHYDTNKLERAGSFLGARQVLLFNDDVSLAIAKPAKADEVYFANGDGDDLYFVFEGSGTLRTIYGDLRYSKFDYVFVPRGTMGRFIPDEGVVQTLLVMECHGGMHLLKQWRNEVGQLRMDAPYCHRDFRRPVFNGPSDEGIRHVVVKRQGRFAGFEYDESPLDLVGYDGSVYPWVFPILAFQPRVGLVHLPPTWHGTFGARGALICSFVPRPVDFHEEAIPCPYPHSSVDMDEFLFYCDGNFTSRKGVGPGSVSHHPMGIPHGPHPGSYEASIGSKHTTELAVMLDTLKPLMTSQPALGVEDPNYHESFR